MIKSAKPISMSESLDYLKNKEIEAYIKKFVKLDGKKAKELREKLESLDLIKLNEKHIAKFIDMLPENKEELNKIATDTNFEEDEINKILQTIKEFK
jgi:DNA-directed RNA polymerase subunit F